MNILNYKAVFLSLACLPTALEPRGSTVPALCGRTSSLEVYLEFSQRASYPASLPST
jgi:hypothetical protein